ncbi:tetratricopeptide repeat protein [Parvularcula maris]|uniref:Cell division coordinator CpoB n=1 Tax=Parvularcula maris TaxID=2965077 RepID=A0A9X2LBE3_9PROT|nr:tetratricopeptide repeat protein [Parvularcula maris]MCQ8185437.1 tetratricopeptide repeat protein [Parvularcula maris]
MRAITFGLAALLAAASSLPADAEAQRRRGGDEARLEDIEEQLRDLQGAVFGQDREGAPVRFQGADPSGRAAAAAQDPQMNAETLVRIGALEREIQSLTGQVEQLNFQLRQQQQIIRELYAAVYPDGDGPGLSLGGQAEVVRSGGSLDPVTGGPVDLVGGGAAGDALPTYANAEAAFAAGRSALLEARYADAERAFLALTEQFPDSDRAGDATYYLGETYLAQGDLGAAARTFLDFVRNYPDNPRAAEAHLKLGQAFARADKVNEACRVWARGLQTYRDMDESLRRRMQDMRDVTCNS